MVTQAKLLLSRLVCNKRSKPANGPIADQSDHWKTTV